MISVGTKSLLIGAHWPLHLVQVALAWRWIYGAWPTWKEGIAIALHDIGYIGCKELDGPDGTRHPELGAVIAENLLGAEYGALVRGHSKGYADLVGVPLSKMYGADKAAHAFVWSRSYVLRTAITGELKQYRATGPGGRPRKAMELPATVWFRMIRAWLVYDGVAHALSIMDTDGRIGRRDR